MSEDPPVAAASGAHDDEPTVATRPPRDRDRLVVAGVAVGLRVIATLTLSRTPVGLHDPLLYQRFAQGIAKGDGYVSFYGEPTSYYPPGYPFFVGALQWVCDRLSIHDRLPLVAGLAQAVLGGVAVWAVVGVGDRLARRLTGREGHGRDARPLLRYGLVAGAVLAVWPNLVLHSTVLLSETLFVALLACFLLAIVTALDIEPGAPTRTTLLLPLGAGAVLGMAVLVRPQVALVLAALVIAVLLSRRTWRERTLAVALPVVGMILVVTPWTIRNSTVFDRIVPVSTNGGDNLCVGFHPGATGHFEVPAYCDTGEFYIQGPGPEARRDAETTDLAVDWAASNLAALPGLSARKLWYTYEHDHDALRAVESYEKDRFLPSGLRSALSLVSDAYYVVVLVGSAVGAVLILLRARSRGDRDARPAVALLLVATAASALVPVLFFGETRFKVPATPCFALLDAMLIVTLVEVRRRSRVEPEVVV